MAWNGSGAFSRTNGTYSGANVWASDEAASVNIESTRHDTHDKDLSDGINNCLTKDVQNEPSAHVSWAGKVWWGGISSGTANAITLSLSPAPTAYYAGMRIVFVSQTTNTSSTTINVNGLGAKSVKASDNSDLNSGVILTGSLYELIYDGSSFRFMYKF